MSLHSVPLFSFDFLPSRPVEIEVSANPLTSDAGLLPVRQFDLNRSASPNSSPPPSTTAATRLSPRSRS